ncbi:hypothetical protein [Halanaerobacter jeridensis]|uniref:Uncharacterized protein n=1 Tax=Halanaerobacter jeridensis TaxID=706427 RepID=A0A938XR09_9FIRM|nr:hypothetical protein [Halanaerobacter jeridensis]MBM7556021.1 hypothetical protein [Halanaerobacter jeridensis]
MQLNNLNTKGSNNSVDLLTTILINYSVINKVNINCNDLDLFFLVQKKITNNEWRETVKLIQQQYRVFNKLEGYKNTCLKIKMDNYQDLTTIKLSTRLKYLTSEQIKILVIILEKIFLSELVQEDLNMYEYKSTSLTELLSLVKREANNNYLAYKEENKIFVYHKGTLE